VDMVKVGLKELSEDVTSVLFAADPPYSHAMFNIVLPNGMMTQVDGSTMIVHSRLCRDVFRSLIVRI
jgi:hypothetical protein